MPIGLPWLCTWNIPGIWVDMERVSFHFIIVVNIIFTITTYLRTKKNQLDLWIWTAAIYRESCPITPTKTYFDIAGEESALREESVYFLSIKKDGSCLVGSSINPHFISFRIICFFRHTTLVVCEGLTCKYGGVTSDDDTHVPDVNVHIIFFPDLRAGVHLNIKLHHTAPLTPLYVYEKEKNI